MDLIFRDINLVDGPIAPLQTTTRASPTIHVNQINIQMYTNIYNTLRIPKQAHPILRYSYNQSYKNTFANSIQAAFSK